MSEVRSFPLYYIGIHVQPSLDQYSKSVRYTTSSMRFEYVILSGNENNTIIRDDNYLQYVVSI